MKYICEFCGAIHKEIDSAQSCEAKCKHRKEVEEKNRLERQRRRKEITELIKKYNADYNTDYAWLLQF